MAGHKFKLSDVIRIMREDADDMERQIASGHLSSDQEIPEGGHFIRYDWKHRIQVEVKVAKPANEAEAAEYQP